MLPFAQLVKIRNSTCIEVLRSNASLSMAQKAAKTTAKRNTEILKRTQLIALAVHGFYLLLRILLFRRSWTRGAIITYILLSLPSVVIQIVFERNSRPRYNGNELKSSGEDLEAKGLTEWMWDILYWTWICIGLAAVFGDWAWYLYVREDARMS